jgi:hypothetical protein
MMLAWCLTISNFGQRCSLNFYRSSVRKWSVGNCGMAEKRTKADKAQRQADRLEKKARQPHAQRPKKKPREDFSQAAARVRCA